MRIIATGLLFAALSLSALTARAEDYVLTLKDHKFTPQELTVPAGQKVKLIVRNDGDATAEFESATLNREKIVNSKSAINVFIGPLDAGRYDYFDDFHRETTGVIVAK